jgi:uncharacterized OsmC-like protein
MAERLEVTATWRGGWATDVAVRGHELRVDEPSSAGGEDTGPMPTEVFCAALASCFCLAVAYAARRARVDAPELTVVVRADRAGRELRYERLVVEAAAAVDEPTLGRLVEEAKGLCWVSNTLAAGVALEYGHTSIDARFRK